MTTPSPETPNPAPATRSAKDYAIEHAGYLANAARHMLKAVDELATAEMHREESDSDQSHDGVEEARESVSEHRRALNNAIYEFEKRRDRAALAVPVLQGVQGELAARLRKLAIGTVEWRIQDPVTKCYCMSFDHRAWLNPERHAREWLAEFQGKYPEHEHAKYEVAEVRYFTELEQAALDAAAALAAAPQGAQKPVAWALFARLGDDWVIQFPVDDTEAHANEQRKMYAPEAILECRPLYAAIDAALSQQVREPSGSPASTECTTCDGTGRVNLGVGPQPCPMCTTGKKGGADLTTALSAPGCERLRAWYESGPVQRAAVESFVDAIAGASGGVNSSSTTTQKGPA